jgi:hypothetical protein
VAESQFVDAEVGVASCLPSPSTPVTVSDRVGTACNASVDDFADSGLSHQFAMTLKLPRWRDGFPFVDLTLRGWRGAPISDTRGEHQDGSGAELVVTQTLGAVDALLGYSTPVSLVRRTGGWRSTFAGLTWYAARGTRLEVVADRAQDVTTATIDRTITLRLLHGTSDRSGRVTAWAIRALDDRATAWQFGAGFEVAF